MFRYFSPRRFGAIWFTELGPDDLDLKIELRGRFFLIYDGSN